MKNADSQVILHAKNWFKKTDTIEDLRKVYAKRNGMYLEDVSDRDIYEMLTSLVFELRIKNELNSDCWFRELMVGILTDYSGLIDRDTTTRVEIIKKYLSIISRRYIMGGSII